MEIEPTFVLHQRPYRETSLLVEAFSMSFGRIGLVAKGARRRSSSLRGVLQPFHPLLCSWGGRGELRSLVSAENQGPVRPLAGNGVLSGFYVNELLLRLLHRDDPHPELYRFYAATIERLQQPLGQEAALRLFEKNLLDTIGYGLVLDHDVDTGAQITARKNYRYLPDRGPVPERGENDAGVQVSGATLIALANERVETPACLRETKLLMRSVLRVYLGDKPLASRALFRRVESS